MIPRINALYSGHALASVRSTRRAARGLEQIARATKGLFLNSRVRRAWSLGNQLVLVSSSVVSTQIAAMAASKAPNSPAERDGSEPKHSLRHYGFSNLSKTGTSSSGFKTHVGIFSRVFHAL